jgi:hypothetical protein
VFPSLVTSFAFPPLFVTDRLHYKEHSEPQ